MRFNKIITVKIMSGECRQNHKRKRCQERRVSLPSSPEAAPRQVYFQYVPCSLFDPAWESANPTHVIRGVTMLVCDAGHQNILLISHVQNKVWKTFDICPSCMFPDLPPQLRHAFDIVNGVKEATIKPITEPCHLIVVKVNCVLQLHIRRRK